MQNESFAADPLFVFLNLVSRKVCVISYTQTLFEHSKADREDPRGLPVEIFFVYRLGNFFLRIMCFQSSFLLLHPTLFEVESQCKKQQFNSHILLSGG